MEQLTDIERQRPTYGSYAFEDTHYYVMRQGWDFDDKMMVISAGLDDEKPDHQHADMLGIQAIAYGQAVLPNYQVRYSLRDFDLFKNSMVKNVALVDTELQGKQWTSNKGGSGFGKFKELPNPKVIVWESNDDFDLFVGSHDGFENKEVNYTRQVIYMKDAFWIVKDNFDSETTHDYKQVWQGHYTTELGPNLIRSSFPDATGCDILQLNHADTVMTSGARGKNWTVVSKRAQKDFNFLTIIFPYKGYNNRIDETEVQVVFDDWQVNDSEWQTKGSHPTVMSNNDETLFFGITEVKLNDLTIQASAETDLYLVFKNNKLTIQLLGDTEISLTTYQGSIAKENGFTNVLKPGERWFLNFD